MDECLRQRVSIKGEKVVVYFTLFYDKKGFYAECHRMVLMGTGSNYDSSDEDNGGEGDAMAVDDDDST